MQWLIASILLLWGCAADSDKQPDYEPLHWITQYEVDDTKSAIAYLKTRPDADPNGIGFFGISKGAASGLYVGADDPYIVCSVMVHACADVIPVFGVLFP